MNLETHCEAPGCDQRAVIALEAHPCCREHFIHSAYGLLDRASVQLERTAFHGAEAESVLRELDECMRAATSLAIAPGKPENLERAQLMDILLWASELCRRMRRGPRKGIAIPVALRSDAAGRVWREDAETSTLSRYGACVVCRHEAVYGDTLHVRRKDTAQEAPARVVWVRKLTSESFEIGFEFLDQDNFWRLDWSRDDQQDRS